VKIVENNYSFIEDMKNVYNFISKLMINSCQMNPS